MSGASLAVVQRRRRVVLASVLTVFLVFGGRLVWVQAVEGDRLAEEARNSRLRSGTIDAPRGDILDADGEVLATSVERYNVGVNQQVVATFAQTNENGEVVGTGAAAAAKLLAPLLGADPAELGARLVGESTFVYIATGLTPEQWREVDALGIPGVEPERVSERVYPNGTTAGNVIGYVGRDGDGLAGLELVFDDELTGTPGEILREIGNNGQVIPTGTREETPAQAGHTLSTTIDRDLQFYAQDVLDQQVDRYGADWGAAVVMEVETGRVLALADSDAVDPNNYQDWQPEDRGSRAVSSPVEPGSTGKLSTFAAALDQGVITPTSTFTVPSTITMPNGQTFRDSYDRPTARRTATGILTNSSNTGTVQIGALLPDRVRYDYMRSLGLGEPTGIELPGESGGVLRDPAQWDGRTRYTTMFGQGLSVTLLQNTSVVATIGNDGRRVAPRLVDGLTDANGRFREAEEPEPVQVIGPEASRDLMSMMESVMTDEEGTGQLAAVEGYRVAGKTGTAEIVDGSGGLGARAASFVGLAPAEDPELALGVIVYKPDGDGYGSVVAGPVFGDIMTFALHQRGIAPSTTAAPDLPLTPQE